MAPKAMRLLSGPESDALIRKSPLTVLARSIDVADMYPSADVRIFVCHENASYVLSNVVLGAGR